MIFLSILLIRTHGMMMGNHGFTSSIVCWIVRTVLGQVDV